MMKNSIKLVGHKIKGATLASMLILATAPSFAVDVDLSGRTDEDVKQDAGRKPAQVINFSGVKSGDYVLDLLGGGGYYSELLSRVVGEKGEVVLQIPKAYLKYVDKTLEKRLANDRLRNVTYLLSEAASLKLGENKFDSAFLVLGYHDMFNIEEGWDFSADTVMLQLLKSLKPGGKLLMIDHNAAKDHGIKDTKTLHRIEAGFAKTDIENRGFHLIKTAQFLENAADDHSLIVFNPELRRKTDRFIMLFEKTAE